VDWSSPRSDLWEGHGDFLCRHEIRREILEASFDARFLSHACMEPVMHARIGDQVSCGFHQGLLAWMLATRRAPPGIDPFTHRGSQRDHGGDFGLRSGMEHRNRIGDAGEGDYAGRESRLDAERGIESRSAPDGILWPRHA